MKLVVCSLTSARKSSLRNSQLIENIVNALPSEVHVLVLVNDRLSFSHHSGSQKMTFVEVPAEAKISIWPQDPFLVTTGNEGTQLITPKQFDRGDDNEMAKCLASELALPVTESRYLFEGGNIVCGSGVALIGQDTVHQNMLELNETEEEIVNGFEALLGMPLCIVGKWPQAVGHIDLIVTPIGEGHFMVADPRYGAEVIAAELEHHPLKISDFERECESDFFGASTIESVVDANGQTIMRPRVSGSTAEVIEHSLKIAEQLDLIAKQLSDQGFQITRVPALVPPSGFNSEAGDSNLERNFPFLTYNNVLIETRSGQKIVYLPQYGLDILDQHAVNIWSGLGFTVIPVNGVTTSAMYGGSLRCCTKVLLRE